VNNEELRIKSDYRILSLIYGNTGVINFLWSASAGERPWFVVNFSLTPGLYNHQGTHYNFFYVDFIKILILFGSLLKEI